MPANPIIIGAGCTGLGAAHYFTKHKVSFQIFEQEENAGGLASSFTDPQGFTWDIGGHVQFSSYPQFNTVMDTLWNAKNWLQHERSAWVWLDHKFIPYPIQHHATSLQSSPPARSEAPKNFQHWLEHGFSPELCEAFMLPYNQKIWAHPLSDMDFSWIEKRIATQSTGAEKWGENSRFRFPLKGGTGAIWQEIAKPFANHIHYRKKITAINPTTKTITCADGSTHAYGTLISTLPLTLLCNMLPAGWSPALKHSEQLAHNSVHVVGLGFPGHAPESLQKKSWVYFPEDDIPFHRATVFSGYSPNHVPQGGDYWSLMLEISESKHKPINRKTLIDDCVQACIRAGFIADEKNICSRWHYVAPYGYPIPTLSRDDALRRIIPELEACGIYSRGRFGAWRYEISNQDHSFLQGVEVARRIHCGDAESIFTL